MRTDQLARAVRIQAVRSRALLPSEEDTAALLQVLARIVEGKSIEYAFGPPGDWGLGTPIGDALAAKAEAVPA